jgi:hypothetical protein
MHLLLIAQLLASAPVAPAQDDTIWYGWQPLLADGTAAVAVAGGLVIVDQQVGGPGVFLVLAGVVTLPLAGPIIHLQRGRPETAAWDLALRLLFMGVGGGIAYSLYPVPGYGAAEYTLTGLMIGGAFATLADVLILSNEPVRSPPRRAALTWTPALGAVRGSPVAGLAGTF